MPYANNNITAGTQKSDRNLNSTAGALGTLSQKYEALRSYGWVMELPGATATGYDRDMQETLRVAVKQIGAIGFTTEDIAVDRVNDKFYYPGKYSTDETTFTFDNLVGGEAATELFSWMQGTFDPYTGQMGQSDSLKQNLQIHQLAPDLTEVMTINLYGAYPRFWRLAELNYSQSEFHTIEVGVRYDFATHIAYGTGT